MNFKDYLTKDEPLTEVSHVWAVFLWSDLFASGEMQKMLDNKDFNKITKQIIANCKEYYNCTAKFEPMSDKFRFHGKALDVVRCLHIGAGRKYAKGQYDYKPGIHEKLEYYEGSDDEKCKEAAESSKYWKNGKFDAGSEKSKLLTGISGYKTNIGGQEASKKYSN